jgi:tight adherence protein B
VLFTPWVYVKTKRAAYYRKFDDQLSDALMLMSNSLRAGFSFMQAMEMVGREAPAPISEEFRRVTQEIALGVPIGDALLGMSTRIRSTDLDLVVTAVIIQREVGGGLAQLLELIAGVIRERQRIKGEIRTLTSQGRLTGMILGLMPFIVGFLIIFVGRLTAPDSPSFIEPLIATSLGHLILAGAFAWEIIGFWLIMRIVNIKV